MSKKTWPTIEVSFTSAPTLAEWEIFCARVISEAECLGIEDMPRPGAAPAPVPETARLFFPASEDSETECASLPVVRTIASETFSSAARYKISGGVLEDQDWGMEWRKHFRTTRIGERVYVGPPWEGKLPADAHAGAILVQIDPGQAFGTGSHETTQLCLKVLEQEVRAGDVLLDIGTGSGILCFCALMLGSAYAVGVENDPVCEENFLLNAAHNGLSEKVTFLISADPGEAMIEISKRGILQPTLVVCNMLSEQFLPILTPLRVIGTPVIFSGFMLSEKQRVETEVKAAGFHILRQQELMEWGAMVCE
ncbi:hypothetical protein BH09SUM1_BH09SUM1_26280 [soil metagenome]